MNIRESDDPANSGAGQSARICPVCGTASEPDSLAGRDYRCVQCGLELAHLDVAANGAIRGIFGWLRAAGDIIENRYRVKSVLGKGGFGATYLVEDLRLNGKRRALKEVPELLFDEYETTLLSRLNHPSIPDIIDRSVAEGMVYLVLEFGGHRTLAGERRQFQGRIPQAGLLPWMRQLCDVLIYLHSQQPPIIHRDLKPDNILLDESGRIMLIDFGIAKESRPATLTRTLGRAATHGFSPPEQAMGTGTDERSDIYALGATFYALLTGENPPAAHERVAGKDLIPPSRIVPELAPELEGAILKALSLNVNHRQRTVQEFAEALGTVEAGNPAPAAPPDHTDRTVILGATTGSGSLRQPSLKLPSGRIAAPKSAPMVASPRPAARRVLLPLMLIAVVLAAILTGAYVFLVQVDEPGRSAAPEAEDQKPVVDATAPAFPQQPASLPQTGQIGNAPPPSPVTDTQPSPAAIPVPSEGESAGEWLEKKRAAEIPPDTQEQQKADRAAPSLPQTPPAGANPSTPSAEKWLEKRPAGVPLDSRGRKPDYRKPEGNKTPRAVASRPDTRPPPPKAKPRKPDIWDSFTRDSKQFLGR